MKTKLKLWCAALTTLFLMACGGADPPGSTSGPDSTQVTSKAPSSPDGLLTAQDLHHDDDEDDDDDENSGGGLQTPGVDPNSPLGLSKLIGIKPRLQPSTQVMGDALAGSIKGLQIVNAKACAPDNLKRDPCQFTFNLPKVPARLKPGAVLVAGVTPATPSGLLVKVTGIKGTTIQAREAALDEALKEGEFQVEQSFTAAQIKSQNLLPGVQLVKQSGLSAQNLKAQALGFHFTLNHVQLAPGVHADGAVDFGAGCGAYGGLTWRKVWGVPVYPNGVRFEAKCAVDQSAEVKVTAAAGMTLNQEVQIGQLNLQPLVFSIGPVPVVLVPQVSLSVSANGRVTANMTFGAQEHFNAKVGILYDKGFTAYKDFSAGFDSGIASLQASVEAKASANLKEALLLYGVVGPQMTESAYLKFKGGPTETPTWCLSAGLRADLYLHIDLVVKTLDYGPANLFDYGVNMRCLTNTAPVIRINTPTAGQTLYRGLPTWLNATVTDAEDPPSQLNVQWSSNRDGALGSNSAFDSLRATLQTLGAHTLTASVTDSGGATRQATVQVNVVNPQPVVTLTARDASGNVKTSPASMPQGDILYLAASIAYPDVNPLPCSALTWNGGGLSVTPDGSCLLPVTLSQQGTFTITATATDTLGNSGNASFQVVVGPPDTQVNPQFDVIKARVFAAPSNPPHALIEGDTFETFDQLQFDMAYLNEAQTNKTVRYEWSFKRDTDATWTPMPATTVADSNTASSRFFSLDVFDAVYHYTFQVQIYDQVTGALLATRVIHLTYQGWVG